MKKNFFKKKLASGLAIALVVASISVPNYASAASTTKVVKQGGAAAPTVLYVGGSKVDFGLSKTYSGNTYTWTTSDSSIATINKSGVVTAVAPGTVTIKCTARDSKGKWLAAFTQKLTIKLRATTVDAASDDFTLYVNETKDLNAVKTPSNSTDAVRYYSDNTEVATVDAKTGVVTAVGVGTATITVYSKATWASATDSKYNKTDSVTVTVTDGIQAVKQTVADVVELTFGTDQSEKLTSSNLTITDADGVKQTISDIDFSSDGKTATVTTYLQFEDEAVYTLTYGDSTKTFTASNGDVASVSVSSKTVQYDTITDLEYYAYDDNGIDVSENVDWESDVDWDYDDSDAEIGWNLDDDDDDVYQIETYDYPDSVAVEMTYSYYDSDDSETKEYTAKATIKSVEEIAKTATDFQYTITDDTSNDDIDWDDDDLVSTIKAEDEDLQLFILAENQDGDDIYEYNFDSFTSTDDDVVTVSYDEDSVDDEDNAVYIYPVDEGTAYIKATYGDTTKLLKVTVGDAAEAKSISVDDSSITLYTTVAGNEDYTVDVDVLDQYGDEIDGDVTPTLYSGDDDIADDYVTATADGDEVTFSLDSSASSLKKSYSFTYKLTSDADDAGKYVKVSVKLVYVSNKTLSSYELAGSDADKAVDVEVDDEDTDSVVVDYKLYGLNSSGQRISFVPGTTWATDTYATIYQDGDTLDSSDYADEGIKFVATASGAALTVVDFGDDDDTIVTQASVATYKLKSSYGKTATTTLKVTNSQDALKVTQDETTVSASDDDVSTIRDLIEAALTVKYDGTEIDYDDDIYAIKAVVGSKTVTNVDYSVDSGNTVTIKSITVKHQLGTTGKYILVTYDTTSKKVKVTD